MGPANGGPINLKAARLQDAFLRFATLSAGNLEAADMSGADLVHARFDDADLSAANLSNANLDHADFSGANLRDVDLSGASLCHAKNLTQAQLEETKGSTSTILPQDLQGFVSWSARSRTKTNTSLEPHDLESEARQTADSREIGSHKRPVWMAGVLLIGGALVITGFVWRYMNDAGGPISDAQTESKPSLTEPKLSLDTEAQQLQPIPHQAVLEKKLDPERQPSTVVAIQPIPSSASTVDLTEGRPEQRPVPGTDDGALVPQETAAEPQASSASNRSEETVGPNAQAAPGQDSGNSQASEAVPLVSAEPAPVAVTDLPAEASDPSVTASVKSAASRHGTVPDSAPDAPDISATAAPAIGSQHSAAPDLPAEAAIADTPSASVTEAPAQQLLSTPATASLGDAVTPSATNSAVPSSDENGAETELSHDAGSAPIPDRKPVTATSVPNPGTEISPKPGRDSVAHPDRSRLAKGPSLPRSRSRVCVPILGQHFEGQCSY
jgi:hypothetical protein